MYKFFGSQLVHLSYAKSHKSLLQELSFPAQETEEQFNLDRSPALVIFAKGPDQLKDQQKKAHAIVEKRLAVYKEGIYYNPTPWGKDRTAFLLPGQGSPYPGMFENLEKTWPGFQRTFSKNEPLWRKICNLHFGEISLPGSSQHKSIHATDVAQPILGLCSSSLIETFRDMGILSSWSSGHSYGELPALWSQDAFSMETLCHLSHERGKLLEKAGSLAPGGMISILANRDIVERVLDGLTPSAVGANYNSSSQVVVSGSNAALEEVKARCKEKDIRAIPLKTSCAFHSPYMAAVTEEWNSCLTDMLQDHSSYKHENVISSIDATSYQGTRDEIRHKLVEQLTVPVQWLKTCHALYNLGARIYIEMGPGQVLTKLAQRNFETCKQSPLILATDPKGINPEFHFMDFWAKLAVNGIIFENHLLKDAPLAKQKNVPIVKNNSNSSSETLSTPLEKEEQQDRALTYIETNKAALNAYFRHQEKIVSAIKETMEERDSKSSDELFKSLIKANESVLKDFLFTQESVLHQLSTKRESFSPTCLSNLKGGSSLTITPEEPQDRISQVTQWLRNTLSDTTGIPPNDIGINMQLESDLGLDSLRVVEIWNSLTKEFPEFDQFTGKMSELGSIHEIVSLLDHIDKEAEPLSPSNPEEWLINRVSEIVGVPTDALDLEAEFESELGLDSLRTIEIFSDLVEEFPHLNAISSSLTNYSSLKKVIAFINTVDNKETTLKKESPKQEVDPSQDQESDLDKIINNLCMQIKENLASSAAITSDQIQKDTHFYDKLGFNLFMVEKVIQKAIKDFPRFHLLGRSLLDVSNMMELEMKLRSVTTPLADQIDSLAKIPLSDLTRYTLKKGDLQQTPPMGGFPDSLLLVGRPGSIYEKTLKQLKPCETIYEIHLQEEYWHSPSLNKSSTFEDLVELESILKQLLQGKPLPPILFLSQSDGTSIESASGWAGESDYISSGFFLFMKALASILREKKKKLILTVLSQEEDSPPYVAPSGIAKALMREWPEAMIRTVFLQDSIEEILPLHLVKTLFSSPLKCDLIITKDSYKEMELVQNPLTSDQIEKKSSKEIDSSSTLLLLGGGTGITATIGKMLAKHYKCHIAVVGRTAFPGKPPHDKILTEGEVRKQVVQSLTKKHQGRVDPILLANQVKEDLRIQEIFETKKEIEQAGGSFSYHRGDISKEESLVPIIAEVKERFGSINGVIHGAGLIRDKLIEKKSLSDFRQVFKTKVNSLFTLKNLLEKDPLKFVFFFSSLASYTGTPGQTDYVAANEVLNSFAKNWNHSASFPVKSLLWSVWSESGLLTDVQKREIERENLHGITDEMGGSAFLQELQSEINHEPWVLLTTGSMLKYTLKGSQK